MNKLRSILVIAFCVIQQTVWPCPVCDRHQPKILRGVVHGSGPDSQFDYWIIGAVAMIVLATLFFSIKWLIRPMEKERTHIKRMIINEVDV